MYVSTPHVSFSETGTPIFEWWCGSKKLSVYAYNSELQYLKVWGTNIETEMEHKAFNPEDFPKIYGWLLHKEV